MHLAVESHQHPRMETTTASEFPDSVDNYVLRSCCNFFYKLLISASSMPMEQGCFEIFRDGYFHCF